MSQTNGRRWIVSRVNNTVELAEMENGSKMHILPRESLKVRNHSPDGFEVGYGGSGPGQLALAIMLRYYKGDTDEALRHYQDFKWKFVATADRDNGFAVSDIEIFQWLKAESEAKK